MRRRLLLIILALSLSASTGCGGFIPAPLKDGAYLKYQLRSKDFSGSCKLTFKRVNNTYFEVIADDPKGILGSPFAKPNPKDGKVMVNMWMKRRNGRPLELDQLGPIWIPPSERAKGGRASVDFVFSGTFEDELKKWKRWEVYAVTATIFRGAFSGTWYYDRTTGFLVGHEKKTAVTSFFTKTPPYWILTGSNIEGLFGKAPSVEPGRAIPSEAVPGDERPRLILLKNGGVLKGVISKETKTYIVLELGGGSTTISKEEIKEIR
jgi:hypothetical protein